MYALIERFGQKKLIILIGGVMLINLILFYIPGLPGSIPNITWNNQNVIIPDMKISLNTNDIYGFLTLIDSNSHAAFQIMHLTTDLVFPLVYSLFFFSLLSFYTLTSGLKFKYFLFIPFLPAGFDLMENFSLIYITEKYPMYLQWMMVFSRFSTLGKFIGLLINISLSTYLFIKYLMLERRKTP